jgi:hypothetical protein
MGQEINNNLTGIFLKLTATSSEVDQNSILKKDIAIIPIKHYWT